MGIFSEALAELDRNTVDYMIDKLKRSNEQLQGEKEQLQGEKKQLQDAKEAFKKREEAKAIQEPTVPQKPQEEPKTAPQQDDGKIFQLCLELNLTKTQADALKAFLVQNGINHRKINKEEMK